VAERRLPADRLAELERLAKREHESTKGWVQSPTKQLARGVLALVAALRSQQDDYERLRQRIESSHSAPAYRRFHETWQEAADRIMRERDGETLRATRAEAALRSQQQRAENLAAALVLGERLRRLREAERNYPGCTDATYGDNEHLTLGIEADEAELAYENALAGVSLAEQPPRESAYPAHTTLDEGPCYICGEHVPRNLGWHREDFDGVSRHWCPDHQPVWSRPVPVLEQPPGEEVNG
jgi:hypothetical protein